MGGERELVLSAGIICSGIAIAGANIPSFVVGVGLWTGSLWVFRRMAKADPQMSKVYLRSLRYRGYYRPRSTPFRKDGTKRKDIYDVLRRKRV
jgi:type IV secretion system protein VirB3